MQLSLLFRLTSSTCEQRCVLFNAYFFSINISILQCLRVLLCECRVFISPLSSPNPTKSNGDQFFSTFKFFQILTKFKILDLRQLNYKHSEKLTLMQLETMHSSEYDPVHTLIPQILSSAKVPASYLSHMSSSDDIYSN